MQPTEPIPSDIKTLQDYLFTQFKATDPIEVQNILSKPYYFKYCVSEDIETPDPVSRRVVNREYEEITLQPGETKILMGGAAYIFLSGIAGQYVLETDSQDAIGDLAKMIAAAKLAIVAHVGYAKTTQAPAAPAQPAQHNPNAIADNTGTLPPQTGATSNDNEDAFAGMGNPPMTEFTVGEGDSAEIFKHDTNNGQYRKNGKLIKKEVFEAARDAYTATLA